MMRYNVVAALFALALVASSQPARSQTARVCNGQTSTSLANLSSALTAGSDANVLAVSLAAEKALLACGLEGDSISFLLVAADAYGDVNQPAKRCAALSEARRRLMKLGDVARAKLVADASKACR